MHTKGAILAAAVALAFALAFRLACVSQFFHDWSVHGGGEAASINSTNAMPGADRGDFFPTRGFATPPIPDSAQVFIIDNFIDPALRDNLLFTMLKDIYGGIGDQDVTDIIDESGPGHDSSHVCIPRQGAARCDPKSRKVIKVPVNLPTDTWDRIKGILQASYHRRPQSALGDP